MVESENTNLDWLIEWMKGTKDDHPVKPLLAATDGAAREMINSLASIIGDLERVSPNRLDGKRSHFRRLPDDEFMSFRSELVVAAQLARSGAGFEFGKLGQPRPDLVLADGSFGIEVKARALNGLDDLEKELTEALSEIGQEVHVTLSCPERPLTIREEIRNEIVEQALDQVQSGHTGEFIYGLDQPWSSTGYMELKIEVDLAPGKDLQSQVSVVTGALLSPHLEDIENEIWKVLGDDQKRNQAASIATILLVDITLTGFSWFRSPQVWSERLSSTLPVDCPFIGVGVVLQDLVSPRAKIGVTFRSDCPTEVRETIQALCDS